MQRNGLLPFEGALPFKSDLLSCCASRWCDGVSVTARIAHRDFVKNSTGPVFKILHEPVLRLHGCISFPPLYCRRVYRSRRRNVCLHPLGGAPACVCRSSSSMREFWYSAESTYRRSFTSFSRGDVFSSRAAGLDVSYWTRVSALSACPVPDVPGLSRENKCDYLNSEQVAHFRRLLSCAGRGS